MESLRSALYTGTVVHHRLRPRRHTLRYRVFYLLLDLDEIDLLDRSIWLFSRNRPNIFGFHDSDHGDGSATPLREQMDRHLRNAGIEAGGPIRLLTMPRILGYVFNPISIFFCHGRDGCLSASLYEVNNTFGQRHNYLIPITAGANAPIHQRSRKSLYVSPFLSSDMTYAFAVVPPDKHLAVSVTGYDAEGPIIITKATAVRRELSAAALIRAFFGFPLLTLKVIFGIHWEALMLWSKGVRLSPRPPPPGQPVTLGYEVSGATAVTVTKDDTARVH